MLNISHYTPLADALVLLFNPLVEVVMHDLDTGKIVYISGGLSVRSVGDDSLIDAEGLSGNLEREVYVKLNHDGRLIKSVSVRLDNHVLLCINCDVSLFQQMHHLSKKFLDLSEQAERSAGLFKNDWQDRVNVAVSAFLKERGWNLAAASGAQKKELVKHLYRSGAFNEKNAADYIARVLDMGRATIFNYLREWRREEDEAV